MPTPEQAPLEIDYNEQGYIVLPAQVAARYFPNDVLVVMVKGDELWMLPTRGPVAGGLLLKQRNAAGERSLLAAPYLPEGTEAGSWLAFWDDRAGALRAAFRMPRIEEPAPQQPQPLEPAIAAKTFVAQENGRWVVYLDLGFSKPDSDEIRTERRRIADYATAQRANVAAAWIERTADRDLKSPNLGY